MEQNDQDAGAALHRRALNGETLSSEEQVQYEAWCATVDSLIESSGIISRIKTLRGSLDRAQRRKNLLLEREKELLRRIDQVEARLDSHTRDLLGIGI